MLLSAHGARLDPSTPAAWVWEQLHFRAWLLAQRMPLGIEPPRSISAQPATPHLGASTDEAQEKAGVSVAKSVRLALAGELVPDAVNVAGGVIDPYVRPG